MPIFPAARVKCNSSHKATIYSNCLSSIMIDSVLKAINLIILWEDS